MISLASALRVVGFAVGWLMLLPAAANSQVKSQKEWFTASYTRGCSPLTVTFKSTDCVNNLDPSALIAFSWRYAGETSWRDRTEGNSWTRTFEPPGGQTTAQIEVKFEWESQSTSQCGLAAPQGDQIDYIALEILEAPTPSFTVEYCSANEVRVRINNAQATYDSYGIDFGDGTSLVSANSNTNFVARHTYGGSGPYTISVKGRYAQGPSGTTNNCALQQRVVQPYGSLPPAEAARLNFSESLQADLSLTATFPEGVTYAFTTEPDGSGGQQGQVIGTGVQITRDLSAPAGASHPTCFYILPVNSCGNTQTFGTASRAYCTAQWGISTAAEGLLLKYQTLLEAGDRVVLYRDGELLNEFAPDMEQGKFLDEQLNCSQHYTYHLEIWNGSQLIAVSASRRESFDFSGNLSPITNIASFWQGNEVALIPLPSLEQQQLTARAQTTGTTYQSQGDTLRVRYNFEETCFEVERQDQCGNQSQNARLVCPVKLSNISNEPDLISLSWPEYQAYTAGVMEYQIEIKPPNQDWQYLATAATTTYGTSTPYSLEDNGTQFRIKIMPNEAGLPPSYSSVYQFELLIDGYFPNAFSPNGDGLNDTFGIIGKFVTYCEITFYNRWGEPIDRISGTISEDDHRAEEGQQKVVWRAYNVEPGTYAYLANYTTTDGKQHTRRGTVSLIK